MDNSKKPTVENPKTRSNIFSQLIFVWIFPLLYKGSRHGLTTDDLTKSLPRDDAERLGDLLLRQWDKEQQRAKRKGKKARLRTALFYTFYRDTLVDGSLIFINMMIRCLTPVVLAQLLIQYQNLSIIQTILDDSKNSTTSANIKQERAFFEVPPNNWFHMIWTNITYLTLILIGMITVTIFLMHHLDLRQRLLGARMRIACCSAIYRKVLRLSKRASSEISAGYVVNLLSNDVSRLDYGFIFVHYLWILPFVAVFICWLIWQQIGVASVIGVVGMLIKTLPVHTGLSRLSAKLRMKVAVRTDKRVSIMHEIVQGIQVIKMYAWEKPFNAVVAETRRNEIKKIRYASYIRAVLLGTMVFTERSTLFITVTACVFLNVPISADRVFSMAQYFNILQGVAAIYYPMALSMGAEALVSLKRIQQFLDKDEHDATQHGLTINRNVDTKPNEAVLEVKQASASWTTDKKCTLDTVDFKAISGKLCAIIGPVGSGKTSILQMILGELPITSGSVIVNGELSYSSQEPWLFPGSVRNNILFGNYFDKKRYHDVIKRCALVTDFDQLPDADKTLIGERGSSLSGGQKARISLARAVYKNANIYLMDDPLSAVDAHVGRHLFDEVLGPNGYLAKDQKTRILVTHQVHFLKEADWIIVLDQGRIMKQGTYRDLQNSDLNFASTLEKMDELVAPPVEFDLKDADLENDEDVNIPFIADANGYKPRSMSVSTTQSSIINDDIASVKEEPEKQAEGGVPVSVWKRYFLAGGSAMFLFVLIGVLALSQVVISSSDYFVTFWTKQELLKSSNLTTTLTTEQCLYIYASLIVGVIIMAVLRSYLFFNLCMRASKNLHNQMFDKILHAPMRFFDTNPGGRILNRFSRDMGAIDEMLPRSMMDALQIFLVMIGILSMVMIVNYTLLLPLLCAMIFYGLILKVYLRPAQDLKRLEGICRSPIFGHLSASLSGLTTIRVNGIEHKVSYEFDELQNVHSGVWQLTASTNTACGIWLDCVSILFVSAVSFSFVLMNDSIFAGNVGLAISQAMVLTGMVQYGVRQATESLQQMTSVERVLQYTDISEEFSPMKEPPRNWPAYGKVQFKEMSLKYDVQGTPVIKNLKIDINPTWKVGIVGRTGAGKSSLIGALFRLAHIDGQILIDDLDTASISLNGLRQKISIIPQDPVLFSATIRYNLDPFGMYNDAKIWNALDEVELKNEIKHLDFLVTEAGSNFSVGQRQLICLARAILRQNRILVLDEATANVDPQTDALIQKTIRTKFADCTVLTIAHRLHTVIDSDRILVLDAGLAREFDVPHILLQDEHGVLRNMVEATGASEAESLKNVAAATYEKFHREVAL